MTRQKTQLQTPPPFLQEPRALGSLRFLSLGEGKQQMPFLLVSICDSSSHVTISHFRQRITIPDYVLLLYTSSKHINAICPRIKVLCRIFPQISSAYSHVPILLMSYLSKTIGKSSQWCGTKMALPCTFPVGSNQRSVPSSHSSNVTISATLPCQLQVC